MDISRILPVAIPVARVWVRSQRKRYRSAVQARPLAENEKGVLSGFFTSDILHRVVVIEVSNIPNPWFYPLLCRLGVDLPFDLSFARGITFDDTIVIERHDREAAREWYPLLFHELVHVVQYTFLGLDFFVDRYVRGLVAVGMNSHQNPLEREAYVLQNRFESAPHVPFSVEDEVRRS